MKLSNGDWGLGPGGTYIGEGFITVTFGLSTTD